MTEQHDFQQPSVQEFYLQLVRETAEGIQRKVCDACGIPLTPSSASECQPIPVFEEANLSLLASANIKAPTEIKWATSYSHEYVLAYFKRYRLPGERRIRNEIVVTTNNYCVARFFAAKELMHCFLDEDGHTSTSSIGLVHDLIDDLVAGGSLSQQRAPQTIVDEIAWMGAVYYLIPDSWVPILQRAQSAIQTQRPDVNATLHLAQQIRVPENVLRLRLRKDRTA